MTRKRIASLVVLVGAILIGGRFVQTCEGGPVPVEIHYLLGDPPVATALEVVVDRPAAATFDTTLMSADVVQSPRLTPGQHSLQITVTYKTGARRTVTRVIEVQPSAVIRINLAGEAP